MGGPGDPPEGTPEGAPGGGEDEYRSVVFDESFVRAARLQEYSARERIADHAPAVRRRPALRRGLPRQALVLVLLIALAFGTALYMGVRHPYQAPKAQLVEPLRMTVTPLAPQSAVPGATDPETLYDHSPAARFRIGAEGFTLPAVRRTAHFSESQVVAAVTIAKDYLVESSLDPDVLTGDAVRAVRVLVAPEQLEQFDQSFHRPVADGRHSPTGWLVRFDPARVQLADHRIRVEGTLEAVEPTSDALEVTADHILVYAVKPTGAAPKAKASLVTVRRELTFRFDRDDLRTHQAELLTSSVQAGPLACAENTADRLRPLLAGQTAKAGAPAGTNPYETNSATALCGTLSSDAEPKV
ncbi:SCO2583 family membrane protein [Streptomyces sp. NPDC002513]